MRAKWMVPAVLVVAALVAVTALRVRLLADDSPLLFDAAYVDLGRHPKDAAVAWDIKFENTSSKPIRIESVEGGCSCASASFPEEEIAPGGKGVISLQISVDRVGAFQIQPRVTLVGRRDPLLLTAECRGIQVLDPRPAVVHVPPLTNANNQEITLRWAVNSAGLPFPLGRWFAATPSDFLWLGEPQLTKEQDDTFVVVRATVAGFMAPKGVYRTKVSLMNDARAQLESDCLVVGQVEDEGLIFDPPSLLLGRVDSSAGTLRRVVAVRLRSGRPLEISNVHATNPAVEVEYAGGVGRSHSLFVNVDLRRIKRHGAWKQLVAIRTVDGANGDLPIYAFLPR